MAARVLSPVSLEIPVRLNTGGGSRWFPLTTWLESAPVRSWRALLQVQDPTSLLRVQPAWQVALGDPTDQADLSNPSGLALSYTSGSPIGSPASLDSGWSAAAGKFLTQWSDIGGDPSAPTNGTLISFYVRFGVLVRVASDPTVVFERGQVALTVAVRD